MSKVSGVAKLQEEMKLNLQQLSACFRLCQAMETTDSKEFSLALQELAEELPGVDPRDLPSLLEQSREWVSIDQVPKPADQKDFKAQSCCGNKRVVESVDSDPPPKRSSSSSSNFKTEILCGVLEHNGARQFKVFEEFFGQNVFVFVAANDPQQRPLFRSSDLASKLGASSSKLSMYLSRRKGHIDGIFQATSFSSKSQEIPGLKVGIYFVTLEVCL
jgi:hypothetical protein